MKFQKYILPIFTVLAGIANAQTPNHLTPGGGGGTSIDTFELNRSVQLDTFVIAETNGDSYAVIRPKDVVLNNVAPTGTAIANVWIDTLTTTPADSMWVNHNGTWEYFTTSGGGGLTSLKGAFKAATGAGTSASQYRPYGLPTASDSLYHWALNRGSLRRKKTSGTDEVSSGNGLNVYNDFKYFETDNDTLNWDAATYTKALIEFEDTDVRVVEPTGINSQFNSVVYVLEFRNISNVDSHTVRFDSTLYRTFNNHKMPDITIAAGGAYRTVPFILEYAEGPRFVCMMDVEGGTGLDSAEISQLGFLHNGGENDSCTVGTLTADTLKFVTNGVERGGYTDDGDFYTKRAILLDGDAGVIGETPVSEGPGTAVHWRRLGPQNVIATVGLTTVFTWNQYSTEGFILMQGNVTGSTTTVQLPDPSALLTNLGSITVKFTAIDPLATAIITTTSGSAVLDNGTGFVSSITVGGTDDYRSWTWHTVDGNKWHLIATAP